MLVFKIWAVLTGFCFLALALRTRHFAKHLQMLRELPASLRLSPQQRATRAPGAWPKISVIIPACNEGETIEAAMKSLLNIDYPALEIILVNDRSTDKTGQIIDELSQIDARITPVHIHYLPPGWLGKVNALARGINMVEADWILLSDADVHFAPDALKNAIHFCQQSDTEFMTAIPDVITRSPLLHVIMAQLFHQASLFFNPAKINHPSHRACYGQGAFMLLKKSRYDRSEGMQWLKMEVVDDTGLALMMRRAGAKMAAVSGLGQIELEWYPSFGAFLRGIEKNAFAFSQYSLTIQLSFTMSALMVFLGFTMAPALSHSSAIFAWIFCTLGFYLSSIRLQMNQILTLRPWALLALPLAFVALPFLFLRASLVTLFRGGINWRGTFYPLTQLRANQRMKLANLVFASQDAISPGAVEGKDDLEARAS